MSNNNFLVSGAIKALIFSTIFGFLSLGSQIIFKSTPSYSFNIISQVMAEPDAFKEESLSEEEEADKKKYESIKEKVTEDLGSSAVSAGALADTIKKVAALFGVDVKIDYDKKSGLSCFSLDSAGNLNIVSCSSRGEVLSSCSATAAADWKSASISCSGFKLTATSVE